MTARRVVLLLISFCVGAVLVVLLLRLCRIDVRLMVRQLQGISRWAWVKLIVLNALLTLISTMKWRRVDAALRRSSDFVPSRIASFALTTAGMALSMVLPVQMGMTAMRTLGTYFYRGALKRGAGGTLIEQAFDTWIMFFLALASGISISLHGAGKLWCLLAALMAGLALLSVGPCMRLLRWFSGWAAAFCERTRRVPKIVGALRDIQHSSLLSLQLGRRLMVLSVLRFGVYVLIAGQTAEMVGAPIPLWQMAAAMPFISFSSLVAMTPGGLGLNELTATAGLRLLGTPWEVAARWTVANRILITCSSFLTATAAVGTAAVERFVIAAHYNPLQDQNADGLGRIDDRESTKQSPGLR